MIQGEYLTPRYRYPYGSHASTVDPVVAVLDEYDMYLHGMQPIDVPNRGWIILYNGVNRPREIVIWKNNGTWVLGTIRQDGWNQDANDMDRAALAIAEQLLEAPIGAADGNGDALERLKCPTPK